MATFSSAADFAAELTRLERDMERRHPAWGVEIAREAQGVFERTASSDLGGDPKFSGWPPRLDTQVKAKPYGAALIPTRYGAGPITVAEFGRNSQAGFGAVRRTRDGGVRTLKSGRVSVRRRKRWNGVTAGKGTASDAQAKFDEIAERTAEKRYRVTLKRHFD